MKLGKPVEIDLTENEDKQTIKMLKGFLRQQEEWTGNLSKEVMRLRKIISGCDHCRNEANKICKK